MIRKLLPILGVTFIDIVGFSMLIPMLPYFVTHFGASAVVVGGLMATFSFCQLLSAPLWGNVSDRIGRKTVLIISQIGATIGWAMLGLASPIAAALSLAPIGVVFAARILEGVSGGNISITQAYVADLVAPNERARAFGLIGAMFAAGMVFGPFGGGVLYARFGFATPFLVAAALQLVTLILTVVMLPESRARSRDEERVGLKSLLVSFQKPVLARLLLQKLAIALALYGWFAVFALFLARQLGFSLTQTDYLFSIFAVFNVVMNAVIVGRISAWLGDRTMSNVGLASLVAGFSIVPMVHEFGLLSATMILFSFGMALTNTGITALISNAASDREQGTVLGTSSSLDSLSGVLAPPVSTGLLGALGPGYAGVESLTLAAVALGMGLRNARGERIPVRCDEATIKLACDAETAEIVRG
ncbi:MAG: MFS transporter [Candidatus Eremiobacteraeota bacterium]|nr:MFS transporter [Candidatus Eremiobacteraeota bacterium]